MIFRYPNATISIVFMIGLLINFSAVKASEPLRVLVPIFSGDSTASKAISMTMYFEMIKAFKGYSRSRGAWILYGQEQMQKGTHRGAVSEASWPSVWADIVVWGKMTRIGQQIVVEPFVTLTPISQKRNVQPDVLHARFSTNKRDYNLQRRNNGQYFDLEPFIVSETIGSSLAGIVNLLKDMASCGDETS